jgi:hypothetical protein
MSKVLATREVLEIRGFGHQTVQLLQLQRGSAIAISAHASRRVKVRLRDPRDLRPVGKIREIRAIRVP